MGRHGSASQQGFNHLILGLLAFQWRSPSLSGPYVHLLYYLDLLLADRCLLEDFGLTLASYTTVRILQNFRTIEPGSFQRPEVQEWFGWSSHQTTGIERVSKERQKMTLVMSSGSGCPIRFKRI